MTSEDLAAMRSHRNHIHRYRRLLETPLTEIERGYIERRLSEELCAFEALRTTIFPFVLKIADATARKPPSVPSI